ncbi:MAG: YDG domain-containing protein, partial [Bacteroidota bacterium]
GSVTLTYGTGALAATDAAGNTSTITPSAATGGTFNSGNYAITYATGTLTVAQKPLTVTAVTDTKTYDRTTTSTASPIVTGTLATGDIVNVAPTQTYDDMNYGTTHVLTPAGLTIKNGSNANMTANYNITYTQSAATGVINKLALIISNASATSKIYDNTTAAVITGTLTGIVSPDIVNFNGTGTFASTGIGTGISVTSTCTLGGTNAGNYSLTQPTNLTADIVSSTQTITSNKTEAAIVGTTADVSISGVGTTLSIGNDKTVNSMTVNAGSKLIFTGSNTLTIAGDLLLKADISNSFSANIGNGTLAVTGAIKYLRTIDASKWYFMAFPSDVTINQITSTNQTLGTLGTDWFIKYYDGAKRGTYGTGSNWISITADQVTIDPTLKLNKYQGYIFGLANGKPTTELLFPLAKTVISTEPSARSIAVAENAGAASVTNHGWNLIGQPYLSNYVGSNTTGAFNIYISDGISTYTPWTQATVPTLNPMSAFFIQASTALAGTGITFNTAGRQSVRSVVATDYLADKVQLNLTSPTGTDYALLTMDNNFTADYEIGYDLEKWIGTGTDKPQLYTQLNGINYAFNALPITDVTNLPIGFYTKTAGTSTISANAAQVPGLSKLLLTDNSTNPATVTDLLTSDYSFGTAAGTDNARFVLTAISITTASAIQTDTDSPKLSTANCQLSISNLLPSTTVRIFDALGRMLVNRVVTNSSLEIPLPIVGLYSVQIESGTLSWTRKIVNF